MKRIFLTIAALLCFAVAMSDADAARRLGGGTSSGLQRNNVMQRQAAPAAPANQAVPAKPAQASPAAPAAPAPSGMSRWLGPLAGLALGAGLASLFMGGGMGGFGGVLMIVLLAAAAFLLFSRLRRASPPEPQLAGAGNFAGRAGPIAGAAAPLQFESGAGHSGLTSVPASAPVNVPAGFDVDAFLRQAKLNFMRLQAANDRKDLHDIRNFTTPEMFAEISLQAQERGEDAQQVDVSELNAELLDVTEGSEEHLASVRFFGTLREAASAPPEAFDEVWHLAKPASGKTGWLIAGIQQFA